MRSSVLEMFTSAYRDGTAFQLGRDEQLLAFGRNFCGDPHWQDTLTQTRSQTKSDLFVSVVTVRERITYDASRLNARQDYPLRAFAIRFSFVVTTGYGRDLQQPVLALDLPLGVRVVLVDQSEPRLSSARPMVNTLRCGHLTLVLIFAGVVPCFSDTCSSLNYNLPKYHLSSRTILQRRHSTHHHVFKTIATFATFALSAVSVFAAPAGDAETGALVKKAQLQSLPQIFAGATQSLTPLTQQLQGLGHNDLTTAKVTPIVNNIKTVLNGVVTNVKGLQGQPSSVVLDNNGVSPNFPFHGPISIGAVAAIIAELLRIVLTALAAVVAILTAHPIAAAIEIHVLLVEVGQLLGTVVFTVTSILGFLLPGLGLLLGGLLGDLGFIIADLGLSLLGGILGILL
ncbi:hypothetical protein BC629DRAFT_1434990 [Irpex lacteus]|nr:hypothetical protein BC629DRAFT_1434990 [Irpex lacteus]